MKQRYGSIKWQIPATAKTAHVANCLLASFFYIDTCRGREAAKQPHLADTGTQSRHISANGAKGEHPSPANTGVSTCECRQLAAPDADAVVQANFAVMPFGREGGGLGF
jgi:hypothetical protein